MTDAPRRLLDLRGYVQPFTGLPWVSLGIVGSAGHHATGTSYHIGWSSLKTTAYSRQHPRDVKLKTEAASAFDIGWFAKGDKSLVKLTAWMVAEARAGRRPDTREVIGPWSDGRAYRWAHENGWKAQLRDKGDSHETHTHESYYRDSENSDKIRYFRGYFEGEGLDMDEATLRAIIREEITNKRIPVTSGVAERYPGIPEEGYTAAAYWRSGYGYDRIHTDELAAIRADLAAARAQVQALADQIADGVPVREAGEAACTEVLDRLEAAGRALTAETG
jgi:hypothetical protein